MVDTVLEKWGRIDCLVDNAALYGGMPRGPWDEIPYADFATMMHINVTGTYNCIKAVAPVMKKQGSGKIVNVSTSLVLFGSNKLAHYSGSKSAVVGLTRSMARELGPFGINVNSVAPGLIQTPATEGLSNQAYYDRTLDQRCIKELIPPTGMVGAVVFLCSPAAHNIAGQNIIVDGGVVFQ